MAGDRTSEELSAADSATKSDASTPLDRLKLGFQGIKASLSKDFKETGDSEAAAASSTPSMDSSQPVGNPFASWASKVKKTVAEKVAYDPVPKDDAGSASQPDVERGEAAWASWAKVTANSIGKQVADIASEAQQNFEKVAEKAKTGDLAQQALDLKSEAAKNFGNFGDQAREVFADRGKAASQMAKEFGAGSAQKIAEAKDKAAAKAKEAKEKAGNVAGAAKDKLAQAGENIKGMGALAMSPAKLAQFGGVFMAGLFLISMSFSFLPVMVIAPQKFALLFAFGSMVMLGSFAILKGPQALFAGMIQRAQLPFSVAYGIGLVGTLVATIILKSFLLTAFFGLLQAVGLLYFVASYVPGGKACVSAVGRLCQKAFTTVVSLVWNKS
mmetsp:Transcript_95494/g.169559  ORF Transcript_95494/g.169559 Transcript_95494/m.169559 type:complete len:385 (+) Transcript_95494:59-1213(+)